MPFSDIEAKQIQELCCIIDCEHKTAPYVDKSEFLVVRTSNVRNGQLVLDDIKYTTIHGYEEWTQRAIPEYGDVFFTREAPAGESCLVPAGLQLCMGQRMVMLRPNRNKVDPIYLSLVLATEKSKFDILRLSIGSTVSRINIADIKKLKVATPPLPEQNKIAKIITSWDQAITVTKKLLKKSQLQKKELAQRLLTGKVRLHGFQSAMGKYRLEQLFSRVTTKNSEVDTNVLTISAQHGLIRQEDFFSKTVASETLDNYFLLKKGQFAYNKSYSNGYPMGAIKRLNKYDKGVVTTLYICFEVRDENSCNPEFFEHYFETGLLNNGLSKVANEGGRAHGLLNVKPSDFFGLTVYVPEVDEQKAIATVLTTADQETQTLQAKLDCLKQEKKALMQQLLTGKRRVTVDAKEVM